MLGRDGHAQPPGGKQDQLGAVLTGQADQSLLADPQRLPGLACLHQAACLTEQHQ
jgi:hypothetical protein